MVHMRETRVSMREICGSNEGDQVLNEGDLWYI